MMPKHIIYAAEWLKPTKQMICYTSALQNNSPVFTRLWTDKCGMFKMC